jgi:hypothetical protein
MVLLNRRRTEGCSDLHFVQPDQIIDLRTGIRRNRRYRMRPLRMNRSRHRRRHRSLNDRGRLTGALIRLIRVGAPGHTQCEQQ